jgi:Tol biopolymer transport system component
VSGGRHAQPVTEHNIAPSAVASSLLLALATLALAGSAPAAADGGFRIRTLLETSGTIEGFAHDGSRIVWANTSEPCRRLVRLRDLRSGRTWSLTGRKGHTCRQRGSLGGFQHSMALAGRRALWAYVSVSNSAYHMSLYTGAAGSAIERSVGSVTISGGLREDGSFRPVPMASTGQLLAFADISNTEERSPTGVYTVGRKTIRFVDSYSTFSVAASESRIALGRHVGEGCACIGDATWSPDGTRAAFTSGARGGSSFGREVQIVDIVGGPPRTLDLGSTGFSLSGWSPDGTSLLLEREGRLYVASAAGGTPRLVGRGTSGRWSPGGRDVAYSVYEDGREYVFVSPAAGGARRKVGLGSSPRWSPDGRALLVGRDEGVYVIPLDGSPPTRITESGIYPYEWAPDGTVVAFRANDGLYVVHPDGSGRRRISASSGYRLGWSSDSAWLAMEDGTEGIAIVARDGSGGRRLTAGYAPRWSPEGTRILFVSNGELAVIGVDGSGGRALTDTRPAQARHLIELRRADGSRISSFEVEATPSALAIDGSRIALLYREGRNRALEVRTVGGRLLRRQAVSARTNRAYLGLSGRWLVFHGNGAIRLLDWRSGRVNVLARVREPMGLSVEGPRVAWAEQRRPRSRIRAATLPR